MAGWSKQKRRAFEKSFYSFLGRVHINSKDHGAICLGENLYDGQIRFIKCVLDALEEDIHKIFVLKSRQLGLTTISRAFCAFYIGVHRGLKGALVFDTASNREEARAELETLIEDLPSSLKFPLVKATNREGLTLENGSKILFKSAGVKKTQASGGLGRSVGLSLAHISELCSIDNRAGLESFEQSLSDEHPDRLYIYESTARGFNHWFEMWNEAVKDTLHCKTLFLGWWSKPSQMIPRTSPDFMQYGEQPPTDKELKKIREVSELYDHEITAEQLAWYRRRMNPTARAEGDVDPEYEGTSERLQEQATTASEAFQQTGAVFFAPDKLTDMTTAHVNNKFDSYMYTCGAEFVNCMVHKAPNTKSIDLKVWEEPHPDGVYVLAADPAFGENEDNCRSSIQIGRCYADGLDQVAEYASPMPTPQQFAWIISSLLGWYGGEKAEIRYILELNGPGSAVLNEIKSLKHQIDYGYQRREIEEKGLKNIFRNVKTFIYTRPDGMTAGQNTHFKTNTQTKIMIMNHLRDFVHTGLLHVRSMAAIEEMRTIAQEGDSIKAPGSMKDDRVVALALATHYWQNNIRKNLITQKRTREAEAARQHLTIHDQMYLFQQNQLQTFFDSKRRVRLQQQAQNMKMAWRLR